MIPIVCPYLIQEGIQSGGEDVGCGAEVLSRAGWHVEQAGGRRVTIDASPGIEIQGLESGRRKRSRKQGKVKARSLTRNTTQELA